MAVVLSKSSFDKVKKTVHFVEQLPAFRADLKTGVSYRGETVGIFNGTEENLTIGSVVFLEFLREDGTYNVGVPEYPGFSSLGVIASAVAPLSHGSAYLRGIIPVRSTSLDVTPGRRCVELAKKHIVKPRNDAYGSFLVLGVDTIQQVLICRFDPEQRAF